MKTSVSMEIKNKIIIILGMAITNRVKDLGIIIITSIIIIIIIIIMAIRSLYWKTIMERAKKLIITIKIIIKTIMKRVRITITIIIIKNNNNKEEEGGSKQLQLLYTITSRKRRIITMGEIKIITIMMMMTMIIMGITHIIKKIMGIIIRIIGIIIGWIIRGKKTSKMGLSR